MFAKIPRHTVRDSDFILKQNNLARRWSPWKLAIINKEPPNVRHWVPCTLLDITRGYRRRELFKRESRPVRVLYEISVQTAKSGKRYVMFYKWGWTNANPLNWKRNILGIGRAARQVLNVLGQNCAVFVRRFVLKRLGKKQKKLLQQWRRTYSYAWKDRVIVTRNKCSISFALLFGKTVRKMRGKWYYN